MFTYLYFIKSQLNNKNMQQLAYILPVIQAVLFTAFTYNVIKLIINLIKSN